MPRNKLKHLTLSLLTVVSFCVPLVNATSASALDACQLSTSGAPAATWGCGKAIVSISYSNVFVAVEDNNQSDGYCVEAVATFASGTSGTLTA